MDLKLIRKEFQEQGIFGEIHDENDNLVCVTLEHAYQQPDGSWAPKIPIGTFTCQRGPHRLHGMTEDFITFEITGIDGHSNLLFHWGNYNRDSEGCCLVGQALGPNMITASRAAFAAFIKLQDGLDTFQVAVSNS